MSAVSFFCFLNGDSFILKYVKLHIQTQRMQTHSTAAWHWLPVSSFHLISAEHYLEFGRAVLKMFEALNVDIRI